MYYKVIIDNPGGIFPPGVEERRYLSNLYMLSIRYTYINIYITDIWGGLTIYRLHNFLCYL